MSDTLRVWELRVEHLATRRAYCSVLFYSREDAEKHATEYVEGPIRWIDPNDNDEPHNYAVGFSVDEPAVTFFLRLVGVR